MGFALIPIGRHSLMNGVALQGRVALAANEGDPRATAERDEFFRAFGSLFARMDHLKTCAAGALRENLSVLGLAASSEVPCADYLDRLERSRDDVPGLSKEAMFRRLVTSFGFDPDAGHAN